MQPDRVPSSNPALPTESKSPRFLIPKSQRLRFVLLFSLITGISHFLVSLSFRTWANRPDPVTWQENNSILVVFLNVVVLGIFVGATQWLILRKYLLSWLWIVATCTGYILSYLMVETWNTAIDRITYSAYQSFDLKLMAFLTVLKLLRIFSYLWLGFALFIFLRRYVTVTWWWTFIPPSGIIFTSLLIGFPFILALTLSFTNETITNYEYYLTRWSPMWLGCGLGAAEAIGLCILRKKPKKPINTILSSGLKLELPLPSAPEITDLKQIKNLSKRLYLQINQAWKTDINSDRELLYLVEVAEDGSIVSYHPVNQAAVDYVNQTPLPNLINISSSGSEEQTNQKPLGRFQVIFAPPASLKVRAWRD